MKRILLILSALLIGFAATAQEVSKVKVNKYTLSAAQLRTVMQQDDSVRLNVTVRMPNGSEQVLHAAVALPEKWAIDYSDPYWWQPAAKDEGALVTHYAYRLEYAEAHEQARWVAYLLTRDHASNDTVERKDHFRKDPLVKTGSAATTDYKSPYDRGHLAPANDMAWEFQAMDESFFMSNMSPQLDKFNRGAWKTMEARVHNWAIEYDSLYIITGPCLEGTLTQTIGKNNVTVPKYYYKVVLDLKRNQAIGIWMANEAVDSKNLKQYATSVREIEQKTGIDFFPALPDDIEEALETKPCIDCWTW